MAEAGRSLLQVVETPGNLPFLGPQPEIDPPLAELVQTADDDILSPIELPPVPIPPLRRRSLLQAADTPGIVPVRGPDEVVFQTPVSSAPVESSSLIIC